MSMYNYTTLHDLSDICMIYEGDWPVKFWNYTDYKYLHIEFLTIIDIPEKDHPVALFQTTNNPTKLDWLQGIRDELGHWGDSYDRAEVVVFNTDNGEIMKIYFVGSVNSPIENREVHYNIAYVNPDFHKYRRIIRTKFFLAGCRIQRFFKNIIAKIRTK